MLRETGSIIELSNGWIVDVEVGGRPITSYFLASTTTNSEIVKSFFVYTEEASNAV